MLDHAQGPATPDAPWRVSCFVVGLPLHAPAHPRLPAMAVALLPARHLRWREEPPAAAPTRREWPRRRRQMCGPDDSGTFCRRRWCSALLPCHVAAPRTGGRWSCPIWRENAPAAAPTGRVSPRPRRQMCGPHDSTSFYGRRLGAALLPCLVAAPRVGSAPRTVSTFLMFDNPLYNNCRLKIAGIENTKVN